MSRAPAGGQGRAAPRGKVEITIPSSTEYLALARSVIRWFAERSGFPEKESARIELAVVEALTNIIRHAYGGDATQEIHLRVRELDGGLELEFRDHGKGAPPAKLAGRAPASLEPGGLGIHMMKTCMDGFHYEQLPGGGARLVLTKLRGPCGQREERIPGRP
jgi:anti-sigma regulatory factor (Ser/Thr protein kinase)